MTDQARRQPATIHDVAQLAGVNPSTVSRALGKPGRVSAATAERVRAAAAQLDYRINPIARALLTGRTRTLGLVVADVTNPAVFGIVRGAERVAREHDYTLVIAESQGDPDAEAATTERLLLSVDGLILATTRMDPERIHSLAERKPVVLVNRSLDGVDAVLPDIACGVDQLVEHLAGLGHRDVLYLAGAAGSWISHARAEALGAAAARRGVTLRMSGPNEPTIDAGRARAREVLASGVTAVIGFNDLLAIGLLQAAASEGRKVPAELSVAGFDDIFGSEFIVPSLTTVRTPFTEVGAAATAVLLAGVEGAHAHRADDGGELITELVVRNSTGPRG